MTEHVLNLDEPAAPRLVDRLWPRRLAAGAAIAAAAVLAWTGGWPGLLGLTLMGASVFWWRSAGADTPTPEPTAESAGPNAGRHGAEVMVTQVVPVWSRQLELTRNAASEGVSGILNSFATISGALHDLTEKLQAQNIAAEPGVVADTVGREAAALAPLLAASQRAFAQRDEAFATLARCAESVTELRHHAKTARELARHTRLVAFNASIESQRRDNASQARDDGRQAVATEIRMLATRIGETADRIDTLIAGLEGPLNEAHRRGEMTDSSNDELRLEIDLAARQALHTLIGSLGAALAGSDDVAQTVAMLRSELDDSFLHFQFGDRVSQMLSIVSNDMGNLAQWLAANPTATQSDAVRWLEALEAAYTMEEQRSEHHGNVHVQQSSGVDFF
ncbi:MAG: methyl-accepting chemotaxis protein [Burkholderiaceae bacterium]|nr:methyl-accepting chemotaxis protein [Burkholderiaceae bacterium]